MLYKYKPTARGYRRRGHYIDTEVRTQVSGGGLYNILVSPKKPPPGSNPRKRKAANKVDKEGEEDEAKWPFLCSLPEDILHEDRLPKSKTTQDYMYELLEKRPYHLHIILCGEANDATPRIEKWNGKFYSPAWLYQVGFRIELGHGGSRCPAYIQEDINPNVHIERETNPIGELYDTGTISDEEEPARRETDDSGTSKNGLGPEWRRDRDQMGNQFLTVVDASGIHPVPFRYCGCPDADPEEEQLLRSRFFPATSTIIRTVFTFTCLDDYLLSSQECKTSAAAYFEKLRRRTNSPFPATVPNRYKELGRLSRQWRSIQEWKRSGFGHNKTGPGPGDLAVVCPICPHPGINLPEGWDDDADPFRYMAQYVFDGNFTAQHQKQKKDDVWLNDGHGFMVGRTRYHNHLGTAKVFKEKKTCHDHHAVTDNVERTSCDVTGIGSVACLRHGFFIPHSTVDFQKGERQQNADYAICEALNRDSAAPRALLVYDIMCQWSRNFARRVKKSPELSLPPHLKLSFGIGDFHIHGHVRECYPRYALAYIQGAGIIDGEIVETLWSVLNDISRTTRSASLGHRAEILNDHMNYSNWKKITNLAKTLVHKYRRAEEFSKVNQAALATITAKADPATIKLWDGNAKAAQETRVHKVEAMDYYRVVEQHAPSKMEVLAGLTKLPKNIKHEKTLASLISQGIDLQESQATVVVAVRKAGAIPTPTEQVGIAERRQKLIREIRRYEDSIATHLGLDDSAAKDEFYEPEDGDFLEADGHFDDPPADWTANIESFRITLPSTLGGSLPNTAIGIEAKKIERELRIGQCNEVLQGIRLAVCRKAFLFVEEVRPAETKKHKTKAYNMVHDAETKLRVAAQQYQRARRAMESLFGPDHAVFKKYQTLTPDDLQARQTFLNAHVRGEKHDHIPWFWTMDISSDAAGNKGLSEFYRVNYLRAREAEHRASEELQRVTDEMDWAINYFTHKTRDWTQRASDSAHFGYRCYAFKQADIWERFAASAKAIRQT